MSSSLLDKFKRTSKLARIARAGWQLKKSTPDTQLRAQQALARLLADARGIPLKIGRILATTTGEEVYKPLAHGITPRPLDEMLPVLEEELGGASQTLFAEILPSEAVASLGQVHRARLHDGQWVAIKIQYPDIADAIDAELSLLGLLPGMGPVKKWGFPIEGYKTEIYENLKRELNYRTEAESQQRFYQQLNVDGLCIPKVHIQWCTERVLTQEWIDGTPIESTTSWSKKERLLTARTLLKTMFQSVFLHGQAHGDPHSGNYFFSHDQEGQPQVTMLDFGSILHIGTRPSLALLKLLQLARARSNEDLIPYFVELGYDPQKLQHIQDKLPALCLILFRPFLEDRVFPLRDWQLSQHVRHLLDEQRWWFRSAANPIQLFIIRAFQGLLSQLDILEVNLPWWPLLTQTIGKERLQQAADFQPAAVSLKYTTTSTFADFSKTIHVQISERDTVIEQFTIPSAEVISLRKWIPEEVQQLLHEQGTDVEQFEQKAQSADTFPFTLFSTERGERQYKVWLE